MKLHIPFLALSLCLLALSACGTTATGPGGAPPADVTPGADVYTPADTGTPADVAKTDGTSGDATTNQCCADKGASCGFVAGCPASCGGCPTGKQCTANKCVDKVVIVKKKFGEACGPDKTCGSYPSGGTDEQIKTYRDCVAAQCESNICYDGYCWQTCVIATDKKNNASGADGPDGIEDPGAPSDCEGAADGPAGASMHCTEIASPAQVQSGQSQQLCQAGTNFKPCKADSDCPATEACYMKFYSGTYNQVCAPKFKNPNGSAGGAASAACNEDPNKGPVAVCQGGFCGGAGCIAFCKTDSDCGSGAWQCKKGQDIFGDPKQPTFDVCLPKTCSLDKDCVDPAFYCRLYYNGVKNPEGDPDPTDPTKVKLPGWESGCVRKTVGGAKAGAACNPWADPADTAKTCENTMWCQNGTCGSECKADVDCAANMKCGVSEYPIDLSTPEDGKNDAFLPFTACTPMPAAKTACASSKDCTDATSNFCRPWEYTVSLPNATTPSAPTTIYTTGGLCVAPEAGLKNAGEACGEMANGALCKSGLCLGQTNQTTGAKQPGICIDICDGKATCPDTMTLDKVEYKTYCSSIFWAWAGTMTAYDDLYVPVCFPTDKSSTLADCAATKKCTAVGEVCVPVTIATGPDKAAKIEYHCELLAAPNAPVPTKKVGEVCNSAPKAGDAEECAPGLGCEPDVDATGKVTGYCTALCNTNADCGSNDGMICDTNHMRIPRKDATKAGIVPLCLKKKSCLPCTEDFECNGGYKCDAGKCAPPCAVDADCAGTDGGAKCVPAKNAKGKDIPGSNVCAAACK